MSIQELDENLRQFYAEARNRNGENYSRATLLSLRNGIERFLNTPPNNRGISFNKDSRFVLSNQMLDAKIKQLKKDGLQNNTHKPAIEQEDLEKLKNGEILSLTQPLSLLRNVWFHIPLYWCRRGFEGQRRLKKSSFVFGEDANGGLFGTMSHDETTKNHPGGVSDVESYEKNGRMYKTNCPTHGYSALELFLSKLNPQCEALFQYPKRNWRPSGHQQAFSNDERHQLRRRSVPCLHKPFGKGTAITLWSTAGLTNREIMAISGHRNESSLKSYHSMPSANQLRKCSDVLASALGDNETIRAAEQRQNQIVGCKRPPLQQLPVPLNNTISATQQNTVNTSSAYRQMFNSCTIGNVHITFNR